MPRKKSRHSDSQYVAHNIVNHVQAKPQAVRQDLLSRRNLKLFLGAIAFGILAIIAQRISAHSTQSAAVDDILGDAVEKQMLFGNVHPGFFQFNTSFTSASTDLAVKLDAILHNSLTENGDPNVMLQLMQKFPIIQKTITAKDGEVWVDFASIITELSATALGIYSIDQNISASSFQDTLHAQIAYEQSAITLAKMLSGLTATILLDTILRLNNLLTLGQFNPSKYRNLDSSVSPLGANPLTNPELTMAYIREHDPSFLDIYKQFVAEVVVPYKPGTNMYEQVANWKKRVHAKTPEIQVLMHKYLNVFTNTREIKQQVHKFATELLKMLSNKKLDPYAVAAYAHQRIVDIHPFHRDGNGRTARFIANVVLMRNGVKPIVYPSNEEYLDRVTQASVFGYEHLADYMRTLNAQRTQTLSVYRTMHECVRTKPANDCLAMFKHKRTELLECPVEVQEDCEVDTHRGVLSQRPKGW